jgi:hypothetical protein
MTLQAPYPEPLLRLARKVVWYDAPEEALADLPSFLANLMAYGSPADIAVGEQYIPETEFRKVLANAPAGIFALDAWKRWHEHFGLKTPALPRRRFADGSLGPEAGTFLGR